MHALRLAAMPAFLALCLILGGASAAGIWANMFLQLLAIPIILAAVMLTPSTPVAAPGRQLIALLLLLVGLIAVQLVPLPPALWTALPGRAEVAAGFASLGQQPPWLPLSLAPYRTISSALWLLPAIAVLLGVLRLRAYKPGWIGWTVVSVTVVSVAIGALQVSGGTGSPLYFYEITNYGASTGFFSNANHLATLLVCTFPLMTAIYLQARSKGRSMQRSSGLLVILVGAVGVVVVGVAVNHSLAGLAVAFSAPLGNNLTAESARTSEDSRYTSYRLSLGAAADFMPAGSGIGTFQAVYRTRENPADISRFYMNHVHGDYIEIALETGVPGLALLALFLFWWAGRAVAIWRSEERDPYALAATVASAVILAHSVVDYPLRTAAISALFAMCCALMAEPRPAGKARSEERRGRGGARHLTAD
jgi:lipoprotein signal peptidase